MLCCLPHADESGILKVKLFGIPPSALGHKVMATHVHIRYARASGRTPVDHEHAQTPPLKKAVDQEASRNRLEAWCGSWCI